MGRRDLLGDHYHEIYIFMNIYIHELRLVQIRGLAGEEG